MGVEGVDGIAYGLIVAATAIGNLASALTWLLASRM